jgi:hypothetical protein
MGGRIDVEASDVFELVGKLGVGRQLEHTNAMRRELVGLEDTLHRTQTYAPAVFASIRPVQWVSSPGGRPSAMSTTLRTVSRVSPSTPSVIKRACHFHTTGFDRPDRA